MALELGEGRTADPRQRIPRPAWTFIRHYLEMVLAMLVGMVTFLPLWELATGAASADSRLSSAEVELTVMATAMTVPMVLWMAHHRHRAVLIVEMSGAMYAGFVVLFPFLWWGRLDEMGVMMIGHVLMPAFMLVAMLARRHEYTAHRH